MPDPHLEPQLGARVVCVGWWPSLSKASVLWNHGVIVAIGADHTVIKTDTDIDLSVIARRIVWRPKKGMFVCFSQEVDETVQAIERHERQSDLEFDRTKNALRIGDFVLCYLPAVKVSGFVMRRVADGFLVSLPNQRKWVARDPWLAFDKSLSLWVAKGAGGDTIDA